ncbi:unnamed protein product [Tilletia caries]|nr:unnamed protein product [Tilletia caries]
MIASIKAGTTTAPPQRMRLLISFCIWSGYASSSEPARSSWAPIPELQGGKAAGYRGPLSAKTVTELLDTVLGKQAKRSLTGSRIGYVKYSHYIGWTAEHSQRGPKIDIPGRQMELWQCRICHTELQVLPKKLSNLGLHLYGNKVRGSCLKDNFSNCAEDVPEPDWSADGDPVPIGATSDRRRFARWPFNCSTSPPPYDVAIATSPTPPNLALTVRVRESAAPSAAPTAPSATPTLARLVPAPVDGAQQHVVQR